MKTAKCSVGSPVSSTPRPPNSVQLRPGNQARVWMRLSGLQHPSWQLQFNVALLLHVVRLFQEPASLLVADIQPQRHLLENAVHSNLYHTEEKQLNPSHRANTAHILWVEDGLLPHLLKMKLFEHADTGFIFLTNLSLKGGDPQVSHSCKRKEKEKHFYYRLGCHAYEGTGLQFPGQTDPLLPCLYHWDYVLLDHIPTVLPFRSTEPPLP